MRHRTVVTGLAVLATLAVGAAGCTTAKPTTAATTPAAATKSATETLNDAATLTQSQPFKYTVKYGAVFSGDGAQDPSAKKTTTNVSISDAKSGLSIKLSGLMVGDDTYIKMDLGALAAGIPGIAGLGDKWLHIDAKKAPLLAAVGVKSDQSLGIDAYIKGIVSAEKTGDTTITGKIDLSKSTPPSVQADEIGKLAEADRIVPFTVTLDASGRVASIVIKMPKTSTAEAADLTTTFSDYGVAVAVEKPAAADVAEAPDLIYNALKG